MQDFIKDNYSLITIVYASVVGFFPTELTPPAPQRELGAALLLCSHGPTIRSSATALSSARCGERCRCLVSEPLVSISLSACTNTLQLTPCKISFPTTHLQVHTPSTSTGKAEISRRDRSRGHAPWTFQQPTSPFPKPLRAPEVASSTWAAQGLLTAPYSMLKHLWVSLLLASTYSHSSQSPKRNELGSQHEKAHLKYTSTVYLSQLPLSSITINYTITTAA